MWRCPSVYLFAMHHEEIFSFLPELAGRQHWTGSQCDCRCTMRHVIARPKYQSGRCSSVFKT
ncbi:hypothetical protein C4D60_Mb06t32050 [Musa balbisiana]|uniref:Uncharacterized protein n=1 Tax=Musa balbisiana TaxID=52838 RepID=A0A4S8ISC0_MUSBA|nr:hypothetical protein C4D60_Mb06t32050 [Musa balbisiana]